MERITENMEEKIKIAFTRLEPQRDFVGYKLLQTEPTFVVRVFSQAKGRLPVRPTPYQIFEFKPELMALRELIGMEAAPYRIANYK